MNHRFFPALALAFAPGCALLPPSQSGGEITSPLVQASWEAATPSADAAELLDESLSACTGPLAYGARSGDRVSLAQWCDCYRERAETDRHAYREVCLGAQADTKAAPAVELPEARASPPEPPPDPSGGDLAETREALRRAEAELADERQAHGEAAAMLHRTAMALTAIREGCRYQPREDGQFKVGDHTYSCSETAADALETP